MKWAMPSLPAAWCQGANKLLAQEKLEKEQLIAHGKVDRGYLGVGIQDLSRELVESFGLDEDIEGVLISQVYEDSPAEKNDLKRGDVLIEMDGKPVKDVGHFRNMIAMTMPGTDIDLTVIRKGKQKTVKVKLGNISEAKTVEPSQNDLMEKIGITVQNLNKDLANQFGYQEIEGVLISGVKPGSPAAFAGLRPGMVILEANRESVQTVSDLVKALNISSASKKVLWDRSCPCPCPGRRSALWQRFCADTADRFLPVCRRSAKQHRPVYPPAEDRSQKSARFLLLSVFQNNSGNYGWLPRADLLLSFFQQTTEIETCNSCSLLFFCPQLHLN